MQRDYRRNCKFLQELAQAIVGGQIDEHRMEVISATRQLLPAGDEGTYCSAAGRNLRPWLRAKI